ncbi:DUF1330 domain-containing protein [Algimonas porphyrae]|uniref:DUF1330 domain-containing protein n=1 Tax=Algimonas porphyrae TaxID=1128113 RepID=A0ABQ5V3D0_9PROT|nr:DUF1330 domain-containing protein [Algimonas porphyrae]GLQ22035.1 hypothetical protein GCM10007854_29900 [Algimonas porphyrae]
MKRLALIAAFALAACSAADTSPSPDAVSTPDVSEAPAPIGAYMIVQGKDYAPGSLGPYAAALPPIYAKYGGRYVAFETDIDVAEGGSDYSAVIISAWPSKTAARAFWDSPEYREAIKLREGIGTFDVVIVGALPTQ